VDSTWTDKRVRSARTRGQRVLARIVTTRAWRGTPAAPLAGGPDPREGSIVIVPRRSHGDSSANRDV